MEGLSRAYLQAVAAQAGVNVLFQLFDYGTDVSLRAVDVRDGQYEDAGEAIDVQLRSTTRAIVRDDAIAYDLDVRTYEYLRRSPVSGPRILVLLVMPEAEGEWLVQNEAELRLRRCAYWLSLRGADPSSAASSVRVSIARANVFDATALTQLLDRRYRGEVT
jgi:hypothetical protein